MTERHRDWFAKRFGDSRLIALGERRAGWRQWRPHVLWQRIRRATVPIALCVTGVAMATGLLLATFPAKAVDVLLSASEYRIGDTTLRSTDGVTYTGAGVVVLRRRGYVLRAASSARIAGKRVVGVCELERRDFEACRFTINGVRMRSIDRYANGRWVRQYDDGQVAEIDAEPGTPCPFPVGR